MRHSSRRTVSIASLCTAALSGSLIVNCGGDGLPSAGTGSVPGAGGTSASGGAFQGTGSAIGTGANSGAGGAVTGGGGASGVGGGGTGGTSGAGTGASSSTGGTAGTGTGGDGAGGGADVDQNGKANAKPGDTTDQVQDYLRLGEVRILNNNWGSEDLGCANSSFSVFVEQNGNFGWTFERPDCDTAGSNSYPDFPQVEFGIHPFGIGNHLVTSPEFSSTTLLPLQIKDIQSASVTVDNLNINLQQSSSWNICFEFWVSERDPVNDPNPGVKGEVMAFWGWNADKWPTEGPTDHNGGSGAGSTISSGGKTYTLWVQSANWASGWEYFQYRDASNSQNFSGTIDVKPFIDFLVNSRGYSQDFWISRLEVGSEIDDNTAGTVSMQGITFEVNGQDRPAVILEP